jgi:hypothetical protein
MLNDRNPIVNQMTGRGSLPAVMLKPTDSPPGPRLVLHADCTSCGRLHIDDGSVRTPRLALEHTLRTGHVVVLNGTTDLPETEHCLQVTAGAAAEGSSESTQYWVDIPTEDCIDNPGGAFKNVAVRATREAAIQFAQQHFGADEEGRICLVSG